MVYGGFKDLARRKASDKTLRDKAFNIAKNAKYDWYQRGLFSTVYKFFDKKSAGSGATTLANNKIRQNRGPFDLVTQQSAEELRKPIFRKQNNKNNLFIPHLKTVFGVLI